MNSVLLQNFEKSNKINSEILNRNFASNNLQMNFSPIPVSTKYSFMPMLDHKSDSNVPINKCNIYNTHDTFFPGTRQPPYNGYSENIDKESILRSQFFALQKSDRAKYIPSSNSDLYENNINFINSNKNLDNSLLFKTNEFNSFDPNLSKNIGNNFFYNSTRVQLKNL